MDDENSVYLKKLWTLYFFVFKLLIRSICHGRLSPIEQTRAKQLKRTLSKGPVAHRGGYPEHTLVGFRNSLKHGVSIIEVDLNFTSDGHLVVFHDYTVDRTSSGRGFLCHKTLAEAKMLDVGIKFRFPNNQIPTLIEAITFAKENNIFLILDVKGTIDKTVPALIKLYKTDPWLIDNTAVVSFFPDVIYNLKVQFPEMYTGLSCCSTEFSHEYPSGNPMFPLQPLKQTVASIGSRVFYFILLNWIWWVIGVSLLLPSYTDIQQKRFPYQYYTDRSVSVLVWTINKQKDKQHLSNVLKLPFLTDAIP